MVCFLIEVIVFFRVEVCVSTTGQYKRTQQALTIGFGGVDGEGVAVWWMAGDGVGGNGEVA